MVKEIKKILLAAAAGALITGSVSAPAQSADTDSPPEEVDPCNDFSIDFGDPDDRLTDVDKDGAKWSGTLVISPNMFEDGAEWEQALPSLKLSPLQPGKVIGSDEGTPGKCAPTEPVTYQAVNGRWVNKEGTIASSLSGSYWDGQALDMSQELAFLKVSPTLTVGRFGTYTNINTLTMGTPDEGGKQTQVSYTLNVIEPPKAGQELPSVPDEPAGISDGYDFGNVKIFDYKRGVVEITNIGEKDLAVRKANIVDSNGDEAPEFSVTGTTCKDGFIKPKRQCQVQVQFFPRLEGSRAAFIEVATNGDYPLQIPLTGVGTYTKPESVVEAEKEAEANGTDPVYEVSEPEKVKIANSTTEAGTNSKSSQSVVKAKKKKIKVKWKTPDTDQPVTGYEIRSKFKKKSWKGWKAVDPMPNKKGWIKASVKAKKSGNYKVQVTSSTPWVERGDKATLKIKKAKKKK